MIEIRFCFLLAIHVWIFLFHLFPFYLLNIPTIVECQVSIHLAGMKWPSEQTSSSDEQIIRTFGMIDGETSQPAIFKVKHYSMLINIGRWANELNDAVLVSLWRRLASTQRRHRSCEESKSVRYIIDRNFKVELPKLRFRKFSLTIVALSVSCGKF